MPAALASDQNSLMLICLGWPTICVAARSSCELSARSRSVMLVSSRRLARSTSCVARAGPNTCTHVQVCQGCCASRSRSAASQSNEQAEQSFEKIQVPYTLCVGGGGLALMPCSAIDTAGGQSERELVRSNKGGGRGHAPPSDP